MMIWIDARDSASGLLSFAPEIANKLLPMFLEVDPHIAQDPSIVRLQSISTATKKHEMLLLQISEVLLSVSAMHA